MRHCRQVSVSVWHGPEDRELIWEQAIDRLYGRVDGVPHH
jgi:hypothetical protein